MGSDVILPPDDGVEIVNLRDALEERYLAYALSTIMHRALPDVRDGLKPVHRRLIYAMQQLKLDPDQGFKKCARVVGDVIGKFHPHGEQAVYDTLVRLAQTFAVRYPLVDGQGNFGNIDGDNAAAMRYTEARLTRTAQRLLEGIEEDAVDFRATYDGEHDEPAVLPANFPNLLANGATGIAVGMATSVPPHNVHEIAAAARHLIKAPNAGAEDLIEIVPGPDFPTGGIIVDEREAILEAYKTGRGGFRIRARWHKEDAGRGTYVIVVAEIPYQVQKSKLVEKIAELLQARKLPLLADVRDESAEDIRLVLEPKSRSVDPELLMESLFKTTDLENRVSLNMNVLTDSQVPRVLPLDRVIRHWLDHRKAVLVRRSEFRLEKIEKRLEVLDGYLIVYLNLDEVIRIVREEDNPKAELMAAFTLTENQAEAVLNMRLRSLKKLEEFEIRREHEKLTGERDGLIKLLGSDKLQWKTIDGELAELGKEYGPETELGRRRTQFGDAPETDALDIVQAMIEREPITVVLSEKGWIRALKGHVEDLSSLQFKADDALKVAVKAQTTDKIVLFAENGRFFTLSADKLPGGRGHGEPVRLMVDLDPQAGIVTAFADEPAKTYLVASSDGRGFIVKAAGLTANTRKGKQVLNVSGKAVARVIAEVGDGDMVAVVGDNRKLLAFALSELPEMARGRGVMLQRYKDGGLSDVNVFKRDEGLQWLDAAGRQFTLNDYAEWLGARASAGRMAPRGFPRSNRFS
ncbi:MAG: DNA topoisomerase IV subunit A [Hyphomicrobiales bacterium]|nr:DNA topoisomerase IV subunit A [Hyphomicrobiales bacterium]